MYYISAEKEMDSFKNNDRNFILFYHWYSALQFCQDIFMTEYLKADYAHNSS